MYSEYGDYYDDECYEPSKIEQAYQEFLDKTKECMKEDLAQQVKKVEEDKNRVYNREEELAVKERELNEREYQINKKYDEIDKYQDKVIYNWLSKFGVDLTPGQKVYTIGWKRVVYDCPKCNGTGKIKATTEQGEQIEVTCPECGAYHRSGKKEKDEYFIQTRYVYKIGIKIIIGEKDDYSHPISIKMKGGFAREDSYYEYDDVWLVETLGSYDYRTASRKDIYLTEEECQKAIDKKQK